MQAQQLYNKKSLNAQGLEAGSGWGSLEFGGTRGWGSQGLGQPAWGWGQGRDVERMKLH